MEKELLYYLKESGCENYKTAFVENEIFTLEEALDCDEDIISEIIDDSNDRKKFFSIREKFLKSLKPESEDVKKLKDFLKLCKCTKYYDNFFSEGIYFDNLQGIDPKIVKKIIPKKLYQKRFFKLLSKTFKNEEIQREELIERVKNNTQKIFSKKHLPLYILPKGSRQIESSNVHENLFDVNSEVEKFFKCPSKRVLLMLGDAGSGKSLFGRFLQNSILEKKIVTHRVPIFISLPSIENPTKRLLQQYFEQNLYLSQSEIRYVLQNIPLLLILDSYDEMPSKYMRNLYRLNHLGLKDVKIIIACRTSALFHVAGKRNFQELFCPAGEFGYEFGKMEQIVLLPFDERNIRDYVAKYVRNSENEKIFFEKIESENLLDLLRNPFLLYVALESLSLIMEREKKEKNSSAEKLPHFAEKITKFSLYNTFLSKWFFREKEKLNQNIEKLNVNFTKKKYFDFCMALALEIFRKRSKSSEVFLFSKEFFLDESYSDDDSISVYEKEWVQFFKEISKKFGGFDNVMCLLNSCPISKIGDIVYQFLHKSIFEFFCASLLLEEIKNGNLENLELLNFSLLNKDISTIKFISNVVRYNKDLQKKLLNIISLSKNEKNIQTASANSATILNFSFFSFSGHKFSNVDIKGANLSKSILSSVFFENSNLSNVNFLSANLSSAKFENCVMKNVNFGENPAIFHRHSVTGLVLSPNDMFIARKFNSPLQKGLIKVNHLSATTFSKHTITLDSHTGSVSCMDFHPHESFLLLASGGVDKKVCIWDGNCNWKRSILSGHTKRVSCLTWLHSKSNIILATGSDDHSVIVWNGNAKWKPLKIVNENIRRPVVSVKFTQSVFSKNFLVIVLYENAHLCVYDMNDFSAEHKLHEAFELKCDSNCVKVKNVSWNNESNCFGVFFNNKVYIYESYRNKCKALHSYSFKKKHVKTHMTEMFVNNWNVQNNLFAFADGKTVIIVNGKNNFSEKILIGHIGKIRCLSWHHDDARALLATGGEDNLIIIWDGQNEWKGRKFEGHSNPVYSIRWIPSRIDEFCSSSKDHTIRFWSLKSSSVNHKTEGNRERILHFSLHKTPKNPLAFTMGVDGVVLWKIENGEVYLKKLRNIEVGKGDFILWNNDKTQRVLSIARKNGNLIFLNFVGKKTMEKNFFFKKFFIPAPKNCSDFSCVSWSPAHMPDYVAAGFSSGVIKIYNSKKNFECVEVNFSGRQRHFRVHSVSDISWCNVENTLLFSSCHRWDRAVYIWDVQNFPKVTLKKTLAEKNMNKIDTLTWHPKKMILAAGMMEYVMIWDGEKDWKCTKFNFSSHGNVLNFLNFSPNPTNAILLGFYSAGRSLHIFDVENNVLRKKSASKTYLHRSTVSHKANEPARVVVRKLNMKKNSVMKTSWFPCVGKSIFYTYNKSVGAIKFYKYNLEKRDWEECFFTLHIGDVCACQKKFCQFFGGLGNEYFFITLGSDENSVKFFSFEFDSESERFSNVRLLYCSNPHLEVGKTDFFECEFNSNKAVMLLQQKGANVHNKKVDVHKVGSTEKGGNGVKGEGVVGVVPKVCEKGKKIRKFALVIGNASYTDFFALKNAKKDAVLVSEVLRSLDFYVMLESDVGVDDIHDVFDYFCAFVEENREDSLKEDVLVLLYYAGHAVYFEDSEFLIPVDMEERSFNLRCSDISQINEKIRKKKLQVNALGLSINYVSYYFNMIKGVRMIFLDSCRLVKKIRIVKKKVNEKVEISKKIIKFDTNKVLKVDQKSSTRAESKGGLLRGYGIDTVPVKFGEKRNIISFSTSLGESAFDGEGENSPYTKVLCELLVKNDYSILNILIDLSKSVKKDTNFNQSPELRCDDPEFLNLKWPPF